MFMIVISLALAILLLSLLVTYPTEDVNPAKQDFISDSMKGWLTVVAMFVSLPLRCWFVSVVFNAYRFIHDKNSWKEHSSYKDGRGEVVKVSYGRMALVSVSASFNAGTSAPGPLYDVV